MFGNLFKKRRYAQSYETKIHTLLYKLNKAEDLLKKEVEKSERIDALYQDQSARVAEARNLLNYFRPPNPDDRVNKAVEALTRKPKINFGQQGTCTPPKNFPGPVINVESL